MDKEKVMEWKVYDFGDNNSVFQVRNLGDKDLKYAFYLVDEYLKLFDNEDDEKGYEIICYADSSQNLKEILLITTSLPFCKFLDYNPDYQTGKLKNYDKNHDN